MSATEADRHPRHVVLRGQENTKTTWVPAPGSARQTSPKLTSSSCCCSHLERPETMALGSPFGSPPTPTLPAGPSD